MNIELHIERLILDGVATSNRAIARSFKPLIESELTRLLTLAD